MVRQEHVKVLQKYIQNIQKIIQTYKGLFYYVSHHTPSPAAGRRGKIWESAHAILDMKGAL